MNNFIGDVKIVPAGGNAAAGTTLVNSSIVDCAGYDGVMFQINLGVVTSGSVLTAQVQDSADNAVTNMANVGSNASVTDAGSSSNGAICVSVLNMQKRYAQVGLTRGTQNAAVNGICAYLFRSRAKPVTQPATVVASAESNATS